MGFVLAGGPRVVDQDMLGAIFDGVVRARIVGTLRWMGEGIKPGAIYLLPAPAAQSS